MLGIDHPVGYAALLDTEWPIYGKYGGDSVEAKVVKQPHNCIPGQ